jgi:hypothetical protein
LASRFGACGIIVGERSDRGKSLPMPQNAIRKGVRGATVKTTELRTRARAQTGERATEIVIGVVDQESIAMT